MNQVDIGTAIRTVRVNRGMKQTHLAEIAGLSVSYVSLLERGYRTPSLVVIQKICKALRFELIPLLYLASSHEEMEMLGDAGPPLASIVLEDLS